MVKDLAPARSYSRGGAIARGRSSDAPDPVSLGVRPNTRRGAVVLLRRKLRPLGSTFWLPTRNDVRGDQIIAVYASRKGIDAPMSSNARRWVSVGSESCSKLTAVPGTVQMLRVRVSR